jgi:hypothetical protein
LHELSSRGLCVHKNDRSKLIEHFGHEVLVKRIIILLSHDLILSFLKLNIDRVMIQVRPPFISEEKSILDSSLKTFYSEKNLGFATNRPITFYLQSQIIIVVTVVFTLSKNKCQCQHQNHSHQLSSQGLLIKLLHSFCSTLYHWNCDSLIKLQDTVNACSMSVQCSSLDFFKV